MRWSVAVLSLGIVVLFASCSSTSAPEETKASAGASKGEKRTGGLGVEPGSVEGTYLKVLWTYNHDRPLRGLFYDHGVALIVSDNDKLFRLNELSGLPYESVLQLRGRLEHPPVVYQSRGAKGDTEIYLIQEGDTLWCVDGDSLLELWAEDLGYGVACSPCVSEEMLFVAATGGRLNCIRKDTRADVWTFAAEKTISAPPVLAQSGFMASVSSGGKGKEGTGGSGTTADFLYAASEDGNVYRLNVYLGWKPSGKGGHSWRGETKARILCSPISYQQRVFVASFDYNLYCFDEIDGSLVWKYPMGRVVREPLFAGKNTVFALGEEPEEGPKTLFAINTVTGKCRWRYQKKGAGGKLYAEDGLPGVKKLLALGRELIYVLAYEKPEIWGVKIEDGTIVHRIPLTAEPDFVVSQDAEHGRNETALGYILLGTKDGRILCLKERRVY